MLPSTVVATLLTVPDGYAPPLLVTIISLPVANPWLVFVNNPLDIFNILIIY